jgi:UDP-N-acetylmuramoyl-L-alanyl-D-glutamate--2,6-diaminopimelate ligase
MKIQSAKSNMQLLKLINGLAQGSVEGPLDLEIAGIAYDSRKVVPGGLFVAVSGHRQDGHRFVGQALAQGAVALVAERELPEAPEGVARITVPDSREALAHLAAAYYDHPANKLHLIGITGTNGKTTTAYLLESILKASGIRVGLLGTIEYRIGSRVWPAPVTTPESLDLQYYLSEMVEAGVTHAVMEVSSHALEQGRCRGLNFEVGVFTNLTRDHLDYHKNMEAYYQAKAKLFFHYLGETAANPETRAIINRDDPFGERLWTEAAVPKRDYGMERDTAYRPLAIHSGFQGTRAQIQTPRGVFELASPLIGRHNVYNFLAAWAAGEALYLPTERIQEGIRSLEKVPGRMEPVPNPKGLTILVDYAHTPEALRFALTSLKELSPKKIITVFGCGGDRDATKRPLMGQIACEYSELAIITSDNPRSEDPLKIIAQIEAGARGQNRRTYDAEALTRMPDQPGYAVLPDRRQAIQRAVHWAGPGEVILIAGKGHENVQLVGDQTLVFDDRQEALKATEASRV